MTRTTIAAAVLLLGTSALAWGGPAEPAGDEAKDPVAAADAAMPIDDVKYAAPTAAELEAAEAETWIGEAPKPQPAALTNWEEEQAADDLDFADDPDKATDKGLDDSSEMQAGTEADSEAADTGMADTSGAGMGGPIESAEAAATPRAAAHNYPPCSPGPGDDNCIQLYEPGVGQALASWTAPTGGLAQAGEAMAAADTEALNAESLAMAQAAAPAGEAAAMGGPYEPVETASWDEGAMSGDGIVEAEHGETALAEDEDYI